MPHALAGVAQWTELHQPVDWKAASSIPSQGTCMGCMPGSHAWEMKPITVSLPFSSFPFSLKPKNSQAHKKSSLERPTGS